MASKYDSLTKAQLVAEITGLGGEVPAGRPAKADLVAAAEKAAADYTAATGMVPADPDDAPGAPVSQGDAKVAGNPKAEGSAAWVEAHADDITREFSSEAKPGEPDEGSAAWVERHAK